MESFTCKEALESLVDYLHGEMEYFDEKDLREHLEKCRHCCDRFEFEETVDRIIRDIFTKEKAPDHLKKNIIKNILNEVM